ncbi:leucine-rich repeat protein [Bacteroides congonensis]|uniref:leucine-rich repeat protein n=1 Tax=Bacteroides congonensis TaxID=1871006 RepID=UPI002676AF88|nr:leucine-rich repeat protein [Bacteroides congonensis]
MKTYCFLVMVMLATVSVIFTACGNDDPVDNKEGNDEKEVTITPLRNSQEYFDNGITFLSEVGSRDVEFACSRDWKVTVANTVGGEYWCTISPKSGKAGDNNAFTITTSENTGYDDRSVVLELEVGNIKKNIVITQKQKDAFLLTNDKFEVDMRGGKVDVEVKANIDYVYEIDELAKSWIKQSSKTRALTTRILSFDISESEEAEKREGKIYFKSGNKIETVHIYQAGENILLLTEDEYSVSDRGEVIKVELKTNFDFEVQIPSVNWIHAADKTRAMSSHTLYYTIDANDTYDAREAVIVYSNKKKTVKNTLHIRQAQKDAIIISNKRYNVKGEGEAIAIRLNTNTQYQFTISDKSWIQQIKTRALVEETLYFQISKNDSELARTGTIVFKSGDTSETITIVQDRKSVEELTLHIAKAGTLPELIPSDQKNEVRKLRLSGNLNGTDIRYLREMSGMGYESITFSGALSFLDLSEANIVEGGLPYHKSGDDIYFTTKNKIGDYAFIYCHLLITVVLPNSVTEIGDFAFSCCSGLTSVVMSNNVTEIGKWTFYNSFALTSVNIPNGTKKIGEHAFFYCKSLTSIAIPNSVTDIGDAAFGYSGLTSITIDMTDIGEGSFSMCNNLTSVVMSNNVRKIGRNAFACCERLSRVVMPNGVVEIGEWAFQQCNKLISISIPNSVSRIGEYAFYDCIGLASITIPNKVVEIEYASFDGCIYNHRTTKTNQKYPSVNL